MPTLPGPACRAGLYTRRFGLRTGWKHPTNLPGRRLLRPRAILLSSMTSPVQAVTVTVLAASSAPCTGKMTWEMAATWLRERLDERFGSRVRVHYVQLFSPESFAFSAVLEGIKREEFSLPVVMVDGSIVSSGTKLNETLITRNIRERLQKDGQ